MKSINEDIELEEEGDERIIDIGEDFSDLGIFGEDPIWKIPLHRRIPNPDWIEGSNQPKTLTYRVYVPIKMLTQAELLRMQEGQRIPKGSRNILDAVAIKRWSRGEVDMFNTAIKRAGGKLRFTKDPRGGANYVAGELSIEDLSRQDVRALEAAISPGMSKSEEDFEVDIGISRRQVSPTSPKSLGVSLDPRGAGENTKADKR